MNTVSLYAKLINGPDDEREALIEEYRVRMNCAGTEEERRRWKELLEDESLDRYPYRGNETWDR